MAGLNLLDMVMQAQKGSALGNIGQQFGLNDDQAGAAVRALLPALSSGLKRNAGSAGGLESLLGAVKSGRHERYLDDPAAIADAGAGDEGNAILGHLLGSKDVSREVAGRAASQTGLDIGVLKQMLPVLATMAMGAVGKQTRQPGMMDMITGAMGKSSGGAGGLLGGLAGSLLGGGGRRASQGNPLLDLLDADKEGSAMDDIFDLLKK